MIILTTWKGPGDYPQLNAVRSWRLAFPEADILLFYTEEYPPSTMAKLKENLGGIYTFWLHPKQDRSPLGTPLLSSMLEFGRAYIRMRPTRAMMWINSDIIIAPGAWEVLSPVLRCEETFFMTGQRYDVDVPCFLTDDELRSIEYLQQLAREGNLLPACGADWFFFDRRLFCDLPSFRIGRCTFDQAMIWDAIQKDVPLRYNMTQHVLALHQRHEEQSRTGPEFQENVDLMKEWYPNWTVGWDGWVTQLPAPTRIDG